MKSLFFTWFALAFPIMLPVAVLALFIVAVFSSLGGALICVMPFGAGGDCGGNSGIMGKYSPLPSELKLYVRLMLILQCPFLIVLVGWRVMGTPLFEAGGWSEYSWHCENPSDEALGLCQERIYLPYPPSPPSLPPPPPWGPNTLAPPDSPPLSPSLPPPAPIWHMDWLVGLLGFLSIWPWCCYCCHCCVTSPWNGCDDEGAAHPPQHKWPIFWWLCGFFITPPQAAEPGGESSNMSATVPASGPEVQLIRRATPPTGPGMQVEMSAQV